MPPALRLAASLLVVWPILGRRVPTNTCSIMRT